MKLILFLVTLCTLTSYAELIPTHTDIAYGPDELTRFDFYQAKGKGPHPLVFYIHGGGWIGGDKAEKKVPERVIQGYLNKGISYARINYRFSPLPTPVTDAAYALQFIKYHAEKYGINKNKVIVSGGSAGAATCLNLLFQDDMADPEAKDPILRESTRIQGAVTANGQSSIDIKLLDEWMGPNGPRHGMICRAMGEKNNTALLKNYDKHKAMIDRFSAMTHVDKNDPPLFMTYGKDISVPAKNAGHGIHHGIFGIKLLEKAKEVGHESHLSIPGHSQSKKYKNSSEFIDAILLK